MNQKIIVKVSATQDLEIPPEIKHQLQPLTEYEMTFNQDEIILKKIKPEQPQSGTRSVPQSTSRTASGNSLLQHAGTWEGDDFEECLQAVYDNRSPIKF